MVRNLVTLKELTKENINDIFNNAKEFKDRVRTRTHNLLRERTLALLFDEPSLRTRLSFEVAINQLGGHSLYIKLDPSEVYVTEEVQDMAMVLSSYVDAVVIRLREHYVIEELARYATIPVINGMSNDFHPSQILTDLFTIREEKGHLSGLKLAYFGDGGGNTAHSMMLGCARIGMNLCISCPPEFRPKKEYLNWARYIAREEGTEITIERNPLKAAKNADIIYTDSWQADVNELKFFWPYRVTNDIVKSAKDEVIVLHCLPAVRDLEITSEVIDGPNSVIHKQARNKLPISKAILNFLMK